MHCHDHSRTHKVVKVEKHVISRRMLLNVVLTCTGAGCRRWQYQFCLHCEGPQGCCVPQAGPALCAHCTRLASHSGQPPFLPIHRQPSSLSIVKIPLVIFTSQLCPLYCTDFACHTHRFTHAPSTMQSVLVILTCCFRPPHHTEFTCHVHKLKFHTLHCAADSFSCPQATLLPLLRCTPVAVPQLPACCIFFTIPRR